jgi:4-hydroxybutyryl-CoA dehydratase/vinylacetyl-CoA-Delta-isomerase
MTLLTAADRIEPTLPESAARIRAVRMHRSDVRITQCITDAKGDRSRPKLQDDRMRTYVKRRTTVRHPRREAAYFGRIDN